MLARLLFQCASNLCLHLHGRCRSCRFVGRFSCDVSCLSCEASGKTAHACLHLDAFNACERVLPYCTWAEVGAASSNSEWVLTGFAFCLASIGRAFESGQSSRSTLARLVQAYWCFAWQMIQTTRLTGSFRRVLYRFGQSSRNGNKSRKSGRERESFVQLLHCWYYLPN